MPRFTLPLDVAKEMARHLTPHASRDDVTPVLRGIMVGGERFGQYAYATDRYTAVRYDLTNMFTDEPDGEVWLPLSALTILHTVGKAALPYGNDMMNYFVVFETTQESAAIGRTTVEIEWRSEDKREVHWMRMFNAFGATGNFPPIANLFAKFIPGEVTRVGMMSEHLNKFYVNRYLPLRLTFASPTKEGGTSLVLVESGLRFKGLIQSTLLLDNAGFGTDIAMANLAVQQAAQAEVNPDADPS